MELSLDCDQLSLEGGKRSRRQRRHSGPQNHLWFHKCLPNRRRERSHLVEAEDLAIGLSSHTVPSVHGGLSVVSLMWVGFLALAPGCVGDSHVLARSGLFGLELWWWWW